MMRIAAAFLLFVVIVGGSPTLHRQFEEFKSQFNRVYSSPNEEAKRFGFFKEHMRAARKMKETNPLATFGVNKFADLSNEEFEHFYLNPTLAKRQEKGESPKNIYSKEEVRAGVSAIDWRQKGAVTSVKDQGKCGACWAFSVIGGIEGQWFLAGNALTTLSAQQLVSCDNVDDGCIGGNPPVGLWWIMNSNHGNVDSDASYPYASGNDGQQRVCTSGHIIGATITGLTNLPHDEDQMAVWVGLNGPLSVSVTSSSWKSYTGGIMTDCLQGQTNHAALIVGFDDTVTPGYWIIKNSWGVEWGEDGYLRLQKGSDQCSITSAPVTSIVPPKPTTPTPSPTPAPHYKAMVQTTCTDPGCCNCTEVAIFPVGECVSTDDGGSALLICSPMQLTQLAFSQPDCQGSPTTSTVPLNQCEMANRGYIRDACVLKDQSRRARHHIRN